MTKDKQSMQDEELRHDDNIPASETDAVIKRGQEAIKAEQIVDPKSEDEQQKDAERWRNEG